MKCRYAECPALPEAGSDRCVVHQVRIVRWDGCYDESWRDLIVDEAFAHPAKMSRGLVRRIFTELFMAEDLRPGSTVVDPFGGIGTTAIEGASRGCQVFCCELEEKFVNLARRNFDLHRTIWGGMGRPEPFIVKGDSRRLREVFAGAGLRDAVVSSPPYAGDTGKSDRTGHERHERRAVETGYTQGLGCFRSSEAYGDTEGQLGLMETGTVEAIISSPPYAEIASGAGGLNTKPGADGQQSGRSASSPSQQTDQRYGDTPGQLAKLPKDEVDAIICSPPFGSGDSASAQSMVNRTDKSAQWVKANAGSAATEGYGVTEGQLGVMPVGTVDAVVASPPYSADGLGHCKATHASNDAERVDVVANSEKFSRSDLAGRDYGDTIGQLAAMTEGGVDAVVASPPFGADATGHVSGDKFKNGYLPTHGKGHNSSDEARERQAERDKDKTYGDSPGQMAAMPMGDAIVSSPPYEGSLQASEPGIDWTKAERETTTGGAHQAPGASVAAAYPATEGNVGNQTGETFWTAARDIVAECYAVLKPGGVAVWVVKAFVRNKQVVDFPGDWQKLCEHVGFVTEMEVRASLVAEEVKTDLWGVETVTKRERKSFFRRLAEKKGSPPIDWETVLFMRKPEAPKFAGPLFEPQEIP